MATTQSDVSMETGSETTPSGSTLRSEESVIEVPKRKIVDVDGTELPEAKRSRAQPDTNIKMDAIKLILHWHEYLCAHFDVQELNDIDGVADITSITWTVHTKLRQDANATGSLSTKITDDFIFEANGKSKTWKDIKKDMKAIAKLYNFTYGTNQNEKARTGTLGSLLGIMNSFRPRASEVRTGTNKMILKKAGNTTYEVPISQFGLNSMHSVLTAGCTYNPTLQSCMKQSLGPMTVAINLCMQKDRLYQKSWKQTFVSVFRLFPAVNEIADILAGSMREKDSLLRMIGDIALWGTTRGSNKAAFPVSMLLSVARTEKAYLNMFGAKIPNIAVPDAALHEAIFLIDFSGLGAFRFWNEVTKIKFKIRRSSAMTAQTAKEFIFHAIWGTHKEDLGLLKWMTGHEFQTRREMGTQFQGRGSSSTHHELAMIKFQRICKLANASQTDFLAGGKGQISRGATFSGRCSQRVSIDGDLFKTLKEASSDMGEGVRDASKIMAKLAKVKSDIEKRMKNEGFIKFGTTDFFIPSDYENYGIREGAQPEISQRYFFGADDEI